MCNAQIKPYLLWQNCVKLIAIYRKQILHNDIGFVWVQGSTECSSAHQPPAWNKYWALALSKCGLKRFSFVRSLFFSLRWLHKFWNMCKQCVHAMCLLMTRFMRWQYWVLCVFSLSFYFFHACQTNVNFFLSRFVSFFFVFVERKCQSLKSLNNLMVNGCIEFRTTILENGKQNKRNSNFRKFIQLCAMLQHT